MVYRSRLSCEQVDEDCVEDRPTFRSRIHSAVETVPHLSQRRTGGRTYNKRSIETASDKFLSQSEAEKR